jgi:3-phenylpropionate/cinnamic acid dioxygenase small subunit
MNELEEGAARAQIRNTIAIYNNAGDRGRIEEVLEAFAEAAVYDLPSQRMEGHKQIFEFLSGVAARGRAAAAGDTQTASKGAGARHHLTTQRIEFTSDSEADAWTYFFTMSRGEVFQEGLYIDHLARTPKGWKIKHRRVKLHWNVNEAASAAS